MISAICGLALVVHSGGLMTAHATVAGTLNARLEIGLGYHSHPDPESAVARAAAVAESRLGGVSPDMALVLTVGAQGTDVVSSVRRALGPIDIAGGDVPALLTDHGPMKEGALVVCVANAEGAASGVAAMSGRNLADAGQAAARLILAGWPFRARYPRGLGLAFARPSGEDNALTFLDAWRGFMGPKMRTVCSVLDSGVVYGNSNSSRALVSVASLEASYATGLGYHDGSDAEGGPASPDALIRGAADATLTALKRLDGRPARLVLVIESAARHRALGAAAQDEWATMRAQMEDRTPCVGWLCRQVAGFGRGVQPTPASDALIVLALGDSPRS